MNKLQPDVLVCRSEKEAAEQAADRFVSTAAHNVVEKGIFNAAIPGGNSPQGLFRVLAEQPYASSVPWSNTRIFFTDERCVPPDHEDSNYRQAHDMMLSKVAIPQQNVHRFMAELPPEEAAVEYERTLRAYLGDKPRLDLVVLGMGSDMHTASLFPESPALKENNALAVANHTRYRGWRLTMTLPLLCAAENTIIMAFGDGKSGAVAQALTLPADPLLRPVQGIQPVNGSLLWIIDSAAASKL